jgi:hypothetical protein
VDLTGPLATTPLSARATSRLRRSSASSGRHGC